MGLYRRERSSVWWMSFSINGVQYQRSTNTANRKLAEKILSKVSTEITEGKWFDRDAASRHTYDEMKERFLLEHAPTVSAGMQRSYGVSFKHLDAYYGGLTLDRITPDLISQYVTARRQAKRKVTASTRNRELAALSKMMSLARRWRWVRENPCELVPKEKEKSDVGRVLTEEEETLLLEKAKGLCNADLPDIILFDLHTGFRIGQLPFVRWSDVDLPRKSIKSLNEKTKQPYFIPLSEALHVMLLRRSRVCHISGLVFPSNSGTPLQKDNIRRAFRLALDSAKIKGIRFHDLRHTAASRLARAGVDIYAIASFLNHSQLSTTKRYAKHNIESLRNAVKMLDRKDGTNG